MVFHEITIKSPCLDLVCWKSISQFHRQHLDATPRHRDTVTPWHRSARRIPTTQWTSCWAGVPNTPGPCSHGATVHMYIYIYNYIYIYLYTYDIYIYMICIYIYNYSTHQLDRPKNETTRWANFADAKWNSTCSDRVYHQFPLISRGQIYDFLRMREWFEDVFPVSYHHGHYVSQIIHPWYIHSIFNNIHHYSPMLCCSWRSIPFCGSHPWAIGNSVPRSYQTGDRIPRQPGTEPSVLGGHGQTMWCTLAQRRKIWWNTHAPCMECLPTLTP